MSVVSHTHNPKDLIGLANSLAGLVHVPVILNEMAPVDVYWMLIILSSNLLRVEMLSC